MYYTVKELAQILAVNEETVRRWIRDGKLQAERGTGRRGSKISEEELKEFLDKNKGNINAASVLGLGDSISTVASATGITGIEGLIGGGIGAMSAIPLSIAAIAGASVGSILKSKDKGKKQMLQDLSDKQLELKMAAMQIKLEILRQQNELTQ